jgi:hypothetical protein
MGEAGSGWTRIDRSAIEARFGAPFGQEWGSIYSTLLAFAAMRNDAEVLQTETNFRAELDEAISALEDALREIDRVLRFDPKNTTLKGSYDEIENQYIEYRKQRGDWPWIEGGALARALPSEADAKRLTAQRLFEIAETSGLDPEMLVRACDVHRANSLDAWKKWFDRTKPRRPVG